MPNAFKSLSNSVKPRERFEAAAAAAEVASDGLLAILLKTGARGCAVTETARRLLTAFGTVSELVKCDWRALENRIKEYNAVHPDARILGVGRVKILELAAAFELVRRAYEVPGDDPRKISVRSPEDSYRIFAAVAREDDDQENFFVVPLDVKNHPLCSTPIRVSRGTIDRALVHPRDVFKTAIRWGAGCVVVAHNHPSGDPTPSREDVILTKRLVDAGKILCVPVVDHLVLGSAHKSGMRAFVSIRRQGLVTF